MARASLRSRFRRSISVSASSARCFQPPARAAASRGRDALTGVLELRAQAHAIGLRRGGAEFGIVGGGQGGADVLGIDEDAVFRKAFRQRHERLPLRFGQHPPIPGEDSMG